MVMHIGASTVGTRAVGSGTLSTPGVGVIIVGAGAVRVGALGTVGSVHVGAVSFGSMDIPSKLVLLAIIVAVDADQWDGGVVAVGCRCWSRGRCWCWSRGL